MILENAIARLQHSNSTNTQNFPALDGFRGIAILLVVLGHYWSIACERLPSRLPVLLWNLDVTNLFMLAGHGVQMFFVMSAFLLYFQLVRNPIETDALARVRKFYWRRFLRIYPAYLVCTLACVALIAFFGQDLHVDLPSHANLASNLLFVQPVTVFVGDGSVAPSILAGTWSLVVEVYFYIALPFLALMARRASVFVALVILMISASITYKTNVYPVLDGLQLSWQQKSIALLNIIPYLDTFAFGMAAARLYAYLAGRDTPAPRVLRAMLVYLPLAGLAYVVSHPFKAVPTGGVVPVFLTDSNLFFNLCSALLIVGMLLSKSFITRLVSTPILRFTGIVSYSVFLTHVSLVQFAVSPVLDALRVTQYEDRLVVLIVIIMPLAVALGTVLYLLIEKPFLGTGKLSWSYFVPRFELGKVWSCFQPGRTFVFLLCWYAIGSLMANAVTRDSQEVFAFVAANLTDGNWSSGVARDGSKLLVPYDKKLYKSLKTARGVLLEGGRTVEIQQVTDMGGPWIHIYFSTSASEEMGYPRKLILK